MCTIPRLLPACLTLTLGLLTAQAFADNDDDLEAAIERARQLSVTEAVNASQPKIDELMRRLDEATPRQRVEIRLLDIRNQALRGGYSQAIDRLAALLDSKLDKDQRLRALRLAANLDINIGRYESGFGHLKAALGLVPQTDDPVEASRIYSLAGFTHSLAGDHQRAMRYATRAYRIAVDSGDISQRCSAGQRLSVAYRYAERFDLAEEAAKRALDDCRQANDQVYLGTVELELAYLALENDELEAAEARIDRGMQRLRDAVWADGILTAEQLRTRLAAARGEHQRTIELAERLIDRVGDRELWERKASLHRLAATAHAELGEYEAAYNHRIKQVESRRRFLDKDRNRRMAMLEVAFNVDRHEQELALLREQQRVSKLEAESRRQQARFRMLLTALAIGMVLMLVVILRRVLRDRRHFRRLSRIDGLTRVSNHTRFFDTARTTVNDSHRNGKPLVLVLGDIDHFKRVNDRHGHIAGDRVLRAVARLLCDHFPGDGKVGRIGGEEFAVCLPGADLNTVLAGLEVFRRALAAIEYGDDADRLTMSFGIAQLAPHESLEQLRERADAALYRAKRGGRDTVVVADSFGR
ncbi:diguanylate cyclase [Wenzhouxiangella sp. XN201]|uniref:diguanylate cyclase n=1 Tax=Wenzhouxiangella sp. XN201 TaxID=2710755 RepID=UPI0013CCAD7F|nr:diguanylate cyclase [Wenzhouxiangella sp. XN201]NEZ04435.1 diguanylate cyclase [Wenzhouxiangella sp. XN201]